MYIYQEEYIRQKEEQIKLLDISAYYNGLYVQQAVASCFSKNAKYPERPLLYGKNGNVIAKKEHNEELTEEQKIKYQEQLLMQLQIMQSNFETGKNKK